MQTLPLYVKIKLAEDEGVSLVAKGCGLASC